MKPAKKQLKIMPKNRRRPVAKSAKLTFHIVTLFPESLDSYTKSSILGRAIEDGYIAIKTYNPRDYSKDKWARVDRKPYGGGPGMVLEAEPVIRAIAAAIGKKKGTRILFMTPRGVQFTNETAAKYADAAKSAKGKDIVIVCGRYEGIDARVRDAFKMEDVSVGPFVMTGGELGALIVMDATIRQVPGILGNFDSREEARASTDFVYTRPESFKWKKKAFKVPAVLLSGNHALIDEWKLAQEAAKAAKRSAKAAARDKRKPQD
jgi:tRNA (guanine37-N1)-methyltransferase